MSGGWRTNQHVISAEGIPVETIPQINLCSPDNPLGNIWLKGSEQIIRQHARRCEHRDSRPLRQKRNVLKHPTIFGIVFNVKRVKARSWKDNANQARLAPIHRNEGTRKV